jgi:glycosyltransferase involved in cell wall biosynthesis
MTESTRSIKRVLMIFSASYDGHYARDLAHGFNDKRVELGFISLTAAPKPKWLEGDYIKDFSDSFNPLLSYLGKVFKTISVARKFRPDVIQTHLFHGGIIGLVVGRFLRIPVVHTRHHIDEHYQSGTFIHRWIDRVVAKNSDHVVVCSSAAKKWLIEIEGVKESYVSVINQGFDFSFLSPTLEAIAKAKLDLKFSEDRFNVICVARYSRAKGQNYLLHAMSSLIKDVPEISLTLMGPGDSNWLESLVSELGLEQHVRILPSRDDVPACIAAADMIIHPSLADSFSQLVIEAQAVGGLLLASDIAAAREQIIDGITGKIFSPRDSRAIVDAVMYQINNPNVSSAIRRNAPSHVRENFTWERMVEEEINCLTQFVK